MRVGWPLIDTLASVPLVAMGDPFVVVLLVASALAMWLRPSSQAWIAVVTLLVLAGLLCTKLVLRHRAATAYAETLQARGDQVVASTMEARWRYLLEWDIFDRTDHALRVWRVDGSGRVRLVFAHEIEREMPLTEASRALGTVQNFLRVHPFSFPVEQQRPNGLQRVLWSDIRYCWARSPDVSSSNEAPAPDASVTDGWPSPTTPGLSGVPIRCGIWFGGTFDREGRALLQIVQIGDVLQSRQVR
ncbi:MAG: hypothetical protein GEU99_13875 [Luteitalea sp.]|nr:hypothetical protein [Luteitalea sp.]